MILIYYDGSSGSIAAVDRVARLWPGQTTTIVAVWQPAGPVADPEVPNDDARLHDAKAKRIADDCAKAGAERGCRAGLNAAPRVLARHGPIGETILDDAGEIGADLIVLGTSRLIGRHGVILGSVSHFLMRHADLPLLVVPSHELAAKRSGRRRYTAAKSARMNDAPSPA